MLPEHKNPIFVSKRPKISKKSPILTQKCQFCARRSTEPVRRGPTRQGTTTRNETRPPGTKRNGPKHNETQPPRNVTATQPPRNTIHETQQLRQRQGTATQWHKSSRRKTKVFFLLSFSDLSHHRTCRSAYGGSLHSVQLNVVVH